MELVIKDIAFSYDVGLPTERTILKSFSLTVRQGEFVSILGRTGCGKTTLALIMANLLKPRRGNVTLRDRPRSAAGAALTPAGRLDVVMVFQVPESQFFEEDVFGEVAFGPSRLGLKGDRLRRRVESALRRLDLEPEVLLHRSPLELSEGEKRKVAIASALSCEPHFLILDEPAISLDWVATPHLFELLALLRRTGVSVIVMTHEIETAIRYSDRVAVLGDGALKASGRLKAEEVYDCL